MHSEVSLLQLPIEELVDQILLSCKITGDEKSQLAGILAGLELLNEDSKAKVQRVFYGLRHGLIEMVD
jgi:hypothetical protein